MHKITREAMRTFLGKCSSPRHLFNKKHRNGCATPSLRRDCRKHLKIMGFADRVSPSCWLANGTGLDRFSGSIVALFPTRDFQAENSIVGLEKSSHSLHTICSTFHQIGIHSHFCIPQVSAEDEPFGLDWQTMQLGTPVDSPYESLDVSLARYLRPRERNYNFLRYSTDVSSIPDEQLAEEFLKEHLRVSFQSRFMSEVSDIDGIFWGSQYTYPLEIKEKTAASDRVLGEFFGLDVGPFVKLAYYAAKRGNLHSMFVVREITDTESRELKQWWFITFDRLAQFASWNQQGGGTNMQGGGSTVVKIPKDQFAPMTKSELEKL